jgi:hypothetical protein
MVRVRAPRREGIAATALGALPPLDVGRPVDRPARRAIPPCAAQGSVRRRTDASSLRAYAESPHSAGPRRPAGARFHRARRTARR